MAAVMPSIARFFGVVITMYYSDHEPPHFHARHGGDRIRLNIETGEIVGEISPRALGLVLEWRLLHLDELRLNWASARARRPLAAISPLE